MNVQNLEALKYPIGNFICPQNIEFESIEKWIKDIEKFPNTLRELTKQLDKVELNWKYRPGGWTIKQIVHHCADSHLNSLIRFKLTLTEDMPTIKPYFEDRWADLTDSLSESIEDSIQLLLALHKKWVYLLRSLSNQQLSRRFIHPETNTTISLKENIGIYAWHCNHHLAHVQLALKNKLNI